MPLPRSSSRELIARQVVARVLASLPENLRHEAEQCRLELCDRRACVDEALEEDLLGLFEGNARHDPPPQEPEELPRIRLFLDNLWDFAEGDVQVYREEVRTTLLHELGHFLGLDEDGVEALGLA
jgi:predicted Zn-dependent protease with MMP-like domain